MALQGTSGACCWAGIHCSSCPEPLLIKVIKVQVNKQKLNDACPAQMKLMAIKCPLLQRPASLAANPMLYAALDSIFN